MCSSYLFENRETTGSNQKLEFYAAKALGLRVRIRNIIHCVKTREEYKMNYSRFLSALVLVYGLTQVLDAGEHPTEHPKGTEAQDSKKNPADETMKGGNHPHKHSPKENKAPENKTNKKEKEAGAPTSWNKKNVEKELKTFIDREKEKQNGVFVVKDEVTHRDRALTLEKIHSDKIVKLNDGTSFVCADFKDTSGEKVDVDFFMIPTHSGSLDTIKRIQVHKIDGVARYTYLERNGEWIQTLVN